MVKPDLVNTTVKLISMLAIVPALMSALGCSKDTAKRTAYESLQNVRDIQCRQELSVDCEPRERYEVYQDKRKTTETP